MAGLKIVDDLLNRSFYKLGLVIGHHPGYFIIIPILLTLLGMTGFQKLHNNIDPEYLFSPVNGQGKQERAIVEHYFKIDYGQKFDVSRITRAGRFGRIIITSMDGDKNILRANVWRELRILDNLIQNITVQYEDEAFTYKDICAKWRSECFQNSILNLDDQWSLNDEPGNMTLIEAAETRKLYLNFPIFYDMRMDLSFVAYPFYAIFGGTKVFSNKTIDSVPALQLIYFINVDMRKYEIVGGIWEDEFLQLLEDLQAQKYFEHIRIAKFSSRTLDHEFEKNTRSVIPYFFSSFLVMAVFSIITSMMSDWVRSKPFLGLMGNVSAIMATMCAFGFCMYAGVDFIGINLAAPFLMIGIGIDDTFVMLAAWRRTPIKHSVPERMARMLSEAAVSITITSVTDFFSFCIGVFSPFPSVTIFCIYSGVATCFLFAWHVTFFAGCVALSGYCEQKNLHSIMFVKVQPVSKSKHRWWPYRWFCSGGVDPDDIDNPLDNREHALMVFFRDYFGPFLNQGLVKVVVLCVFGVYLMGAGYGVTQIQEGLERRKVAKSDSYVIEFFDREDDYFREYTYKVQMIITGPNDYADARIQQQLQDLVRQFENTTYIVPGFAFTTNVLKQFLVHLRINEELSENSTSLTSAEFHKAFQQYLGEDNLDVKFSANGTSIEALRILFQAYNISGTEHEKEMVRTLRDIAKASVFNVTVFNPYFVYFDQYELVRPLSIQNMLVGGAVMMVVSFLFIPNVFCSLWVAFSIVSIEAGVVGYMALWHVSLDSISMINLIMCIGFSVDFTAHICYAYMACNKSKPDDRVRECLYALGLPIVQGAISTILGMLALYLAQNYLFAVFFKMVFLVVFCGAMHGLFLLPVLLSLFGPGSCSVDEDQDDDNSDAAVIANIDKILPQPYCIPHLQLKAHAFDLEKDLGLGTSEENSSESSSNHSKKQTNDEVILSASDFGGRRYNSSHMLDLFDTKECTNNDARIEPCSQSTINRPRRYSPPDIAFGVARRSPSQHLTRSSSYHAVVHPRYVQELRFP